MKGKFSWYGIDGNSFFFARVFVVCVCVSRKEFFFETCSINMNFLPSSLELQRLVQWLMICCCWYWDLADEIREGNKRLDKYKCKNRRVILVTCLHAIFFVIRFEMFVQRSVLPFRLHSVYILQLLRSLIGVKI